MKKIWHRLPREQDLIFPLHSLSWCFERKKNFIGNFEMNTWGWIKVKTALGVNGDEIGIQSSIHKAYNLHKYSALQVA